jgi:ribosomal protein S18 acetylase RimI-like enzyme
MTVTIRDAASEDWRFITALGERTVMDSVSTLRHASPHAVFDGLERLLDTVRSAAHQALVAEVDGRSAGFVLVLDSLPDEVTGDDQAFIAYMAVEPAFRGAGVGDALLARAENEAKLRGAPYIALMVTEENAAARKLYERAGYVVERRLMCKTL